MYDVDSISPETQALLLLCGSIGRNRSEDVKPLTPLEFYRLAGWMKDHGLSPSSLLTPEGLRQIQDMQHAKLDSGRVITLLERGGALAVALEDWCSKGVWVLSRYDESYPSRLADRLGKSAPLLLYGIGNMDLASAGGLAIVGSRNVDEEGIRFTREIAQACASQGIQIVSGAARGVDTEAMIAASEAGGQAVGVVADSLIRTAVSGKFRRAILDDSLLLMSPYDPNAGFSIGSAMGRNKYIYALSDWALVISATPGSGGTWSGAAENLKNGWAPLFVRSADGVPEGNLQLIGEGGVPMTADVLGGNEGLRQWLGVHEVKASNPTESSAQLSLPD